MELEAVQAAVIDRESIYLSPPRRKNNLILKESLFNLFQETVISQTHSYITFPFQIDIRVERLSSGYNGLLIPVVNTENSQFKRAIIHISDSPTFSEEDIMSMCPPDLRYDFIFFHEWRHFLDLVRSNHYTNSELSCHRYAIEEVRKIEVGDRLPILMI